MTFISIQLSTKLKSSQNKCIFSAKNIHCSCLSIKLPPHHKSLLLLLLWLQAACKNFRTLGQPFLGEKYVTQNGNSTIQRKGVAGVSKLILFICWNGFGSSWTTPFMANCLYSVLCLSGAGSCAVQYKQLTMCICLHHVKTKTTKVSS